MGAPIVHFEIGCRDKSKTVSFYKDLFEWEIQDYGPASMINTAGESGIHGHITALGHEPHNYVTVYAQVDDLDATIERAESLGGRCLIPAREVPGMGHFAWIRDPEKNVIGLWKPLAPA